MKRIIALLCIAAVAALTLSSCGAQKPERLLAGKWEASVGLLEFQALEFVSDAKNAKTGKVNLGMRGSLVGGSYEIIPGAKRGDPDKLKITYAVASLSTSRSYLFTVDGDNLTMTGERGTVAFTYHRAAAVTQPAP